MSRGIQQLSLQAGPRALQRIAEEGLHPGLFGSMIGASGGPKWLVLSALDRYFCSDFFFSEGQPRISSPLALLGSSIGTWRHACLAQQDPLAAHQRFIDAYFAQHYSAKPTIAEISEQSRQMIAAILGDNGAAELASNPLFHSHVVADRSLGWAASDNRLLLMLALGWTALLNWRDRQRQATMFARTVFCSASAPAFLFEDFATRLCRLVARNVPDVLLASAAVPLVLEGVRNIEGAEPGIYRDGGILDYHFDMNFARPKGLVFYPHFYGHLTPGWFDKMHKARTVATSALEDVVLVSPSAEFVRTLPNGRIPDRKDFLNFDEKARLTIWRAVVNESRRLAEAFHELVQHKEPVRFFSGL